MGFFFSPTSRLLDGGVTKFKAWSGHSVWHLSQSAILTFFKLTNAKLGKEEPSEKIKPPSPREDAGFSVSTSPRALQAPFLCVCCMSASLQSNKHLPSIADSYHSCLMLFCPFLLLFAIFPLPSFTLEVFFLPFNSLTGRKRNLVKTPRITLSKSSKCP